MTTSETPGAGRQPMRATSSPQPSHEPQDDLTLRDHELVELFLGEMRGLIGAMETQVGALATPSAPAATPVGLPRRAAAIPGGENPDARRSRAWRDLRRLANALADLTATFHVDDCSTLTNALAVAADQAAQAGQLARALTPNAPATGAPTLAPDDALATLDYLRGRVAQMTTAGVATPTTPDERAQAMRLLRALGVADPTPGIADAASVTSNDARDGGAPPSAGATADWAKLDHRAERVALDDLDEEPATADELTEDDLAIVRSFQASALSLGRGEAAFLTIAPDAVDLTGGQPLGQVTAIPAPTETAFDGERSLEFDESLSLAPDDSSVTLGVRRQAQRAPTAEELDVIPPEMKRLFIIESTEDLHDMAHHLMDLDQRPDDGVILLGMSRIAHKMKGSAGTLLFEVFADISITLEIVIKALQKRQIEIGSAALGALSRILGALQRTLDALAAEQPEDPALADEARAIAETLLRQRGPIGARRATGDPAAAPVGGEGQTLMGALRTGETETLLRVDIQRLDDLMNRLSGMSINRASLTQTRNEIMRVQNDMEEALKRLATMSAQITDQHPLVGALERLEYFERQDQREGVAARLESGWGRSGVGAVNPRLVGASASHADVGWDELEHERYTEFDHALRALGEVVADVGSLNMALRTLLVRLGQISETQEGLMTQMQRDAMQMRLTPLADLVPRLQLVVRMMAASMGKQVNFTVRGERTEIDRNISEALVEPLIQLARNAVAHGIEAPEERIERGKPPIGAIWLHAYYVGAEVTIELGDDGQGVNPHRLIASAVAVGLLDQDQARALAPEDAYMLMFRPGVTTMGEPQVMGGSGIGLDEVDSAIGALKGSVQAQSEPGRGTVFRIRVPISLSIVRALYIVAAGQSYAAPFSSVQRTVTISPEELLPPAAPLDGAPSDPAAAPPPPRIRIARARDALSLDSAADLAPDPIPDAAAEHSPWRDATLLNGAQDDARRFEEIPVFALAELLGYEHQPRTPQLALIVEVGQRRVALLIDEAREDMEVVVRTLPKHLRRRAIRGATAQPNGETLLLLDLPDLIAGRLAGAYVRPRPRPAASFARTPAPRALIVDDSVTIRRTLQLTLERAGFETQVARDGLEALDTILTAPPRVIILDVEMPRLDGFELLSILRSSPQFAQVRVVMLTSRAAHKHREYAYTLGADAYLVKPCPQEVLISTVRQLLTETPPDDTP